MQSQIALWSKFKTLITKFLTYCYQFIIPIFIYHYSLLHYSLFLFTIHNSCSLFNVHHIFPIHPFIIHYITHDSLSFHLIHHILFFDRYLRAMCPVVRCPTRKALQAKNTQVYEPNFVWRRCTHCKWRTDENPI